MSQRNPQPERQAPLKTPLPKRQLTDAQAWWTLRKLDLFFYCYLMATVDLIFFGAEQLMQRNN